MIVILMVTVMMVNLLLLVLFWVASCFTEPMVNTINIHLVTAHFVKLIFQP